MNVFIPCLVTAFCWGLSPVIYKAVLAQLAPQTTIVLSAVIYFLIAVLYFALNRNAIVHDVKELRISAVGFLLLANIVVFVGQIIYVTTLQGEKSSIVATIVYTSPIFTLLLSYLFLNERLSIASIAGVGVVVIGISMLMYK